MPYLSLASILIISIIITSSLFVNANLTLQQQIDILFQARDELNCSNAFIDWEDTPSPQPGTNQPAPCWWRGITCDDKNTKVLCINLPGAIEILPNESFAAAANCRGTLPAALENLSTLEGMDFSSSGSSLFCSPSTSREMLLKYQRSESDVISISATMMPEIIASENHNNSTKDITSNGYFLPPSRLPKEWGKLENLKELRIVTQPNIFGSIPESWTGMKKMNSLSLAALGLSGRLGPEPFTAWNSTLSFLQLSQNRLKGSFDKDLDFIKSLTKLTFLSLSHNRFSGTLNPSWSSLTQLTQLHINNNPDLSPTTLPPQWSSMTALESFDCSNNRALHGDSIPPSWFKPHVNAMNVYLVNNCSFDQPLAEGIERWQNLVNIDLSGNAIPSVPKNITKLSRLQTLDLSRNLLTSTSGIH